jgi:hypothetical protein
MARRPPPGPLRSRPGLRLATLLLVTCGLLQACGGCASIRARLAAAAPGTMGQKGGRTRIGPAELDQLTRAFADRYVGLPSTCDSLKHGDADVTQRREAQEWMLNSANNVYDIASNADAFTRMLDLVVVTTLVSQVWVDDGRARDGEQSPVRTGYGAVQGAAGIRRANCAARDRKDESRTGRARGESHSSSPRFLLGINGGQVSTSEVET